MDDTILFSVRAFPWSSHGGWIRGIGSPLNESPVSGNRQNKMAKFPMAQTFTSPWPRFVPLPSWRSIRQGPSHPQPNPPLRSSCVEKNSSGSIWPRFLSPESSRIKTAKHLAHQHQFLLIMSRQRMDKRLVLQVINRNPGLHFELGRKIHQAKKKEK